MFSKKLKGKILIVFSDPGGAKPCLSIGDTIDNSCLTIFSDREYPFYSDFNSKVKIIKTELEIEQIITEFDPDTILTGTSYTSSIEKKVIRLAKKKGILVFSFVDHWTSISDRFRDENKVLILPDEIWVLDERAQKTAIEEGLDDIYISGNPYHTWLKKWEPKLEKNIFYKEIGLNGQKKYILFAPDPLSNIDGFNKFGFDEFEASSKIIESVTNSDYEFKSKHHFLIKMHPNQSKNKILKIFDGNDNFTVLPSNIDTNLSIYFSDIVIGFFSSLLIEADIMGKPVIRFLLKELEADPFQGINLSIAANGHDLINYINLVK